MSWLIFSSSESSRYDFQLHWPTGREHLSSLIALLWQLLLEAASTEQTTGWTQTFQACISTSMTSQTSQLLQKCGQGLALTWPQTK